MAAYAAGGPGAGPLARLRALLEAIGANVDVMDPKRHDLVLAVVSHTPHLIAFTMVGVADHLRRVTQEEVIKYSASGFRDFTRIAASDPTMWRDVFLTNKEAVLDILGRFTEELFMLQRRIRMKVSSFTPISRGPVKSGVALSRRVRILRHLISAALPGRPWISQLAMRVLIRATHKPSRVRVRRRSALLRSGGMAQGCCKEIRMEFRKITGFAAALLLISASTMTHAEPLERSPRPQANPKLLAAMPGTAPDAVVATAFAPVTDSTVTDARVTNAAGREAPLTLAAVVPAAAAGGFALSDRCCPPTSPGARGMRSRSVRHTAARAGQSASRGSDAQQFQSSGAVSRWRSR